MNPIRRRPLPCCLHLRPPRLSTSVRAADDYEPGPDSKPQPGVPKGEVLKFSFERIKDLPRHRSAITGSTSRRNTTPTKPACLYVNQDGIQWQAPTVFDNLIHKKEMPVTIGVFVMHGRVRAGDTNAALDRFNRSYRVRRPGRQLRPLPARGNPARRGKEDPARRPPPAPFDEWQRPRDRRIEQRRDLRLHRGVGTARRVPPRVQRDRHVCGTARRGSFTRR